MTGAEVRPRGVWGVIGAVLLFSLAGLQAAETIPPIPERFFNDYAGVVSSETEQRLNTALKNLAKTDSTQILVAVYPKMESDSAMEDYTVRVARSWRVGQTNLNNGAILFVFMEDRAMRIEVGYGLEGAIPDVTAKRIIENEIIPHFRSGSPEQGLAAGVQAMIAAAKGEYQGSGRTVGGSSNRRRGGQSWFGLFFIVFILLSIIGRIARRGRGYSYRRGGRTVWGGPFIGGFGGRGGFGGGGFGGGFSGGGGSFGGGGASGSW